MDTDGEMVELPMLNDYTGSKVKDEMSEFETKGVLQIVAVCNACHGGEQDNPKGDTWPKTRTPKLLFAFLCPRQREHSN